MLDHVTLFVALPSISSSLTYIGPWLQVSAASLSSIVHWTNKNRAYAATCGEEVKHLRSDPDRSG